MRVLWVYGPAGVGKSTTCWALHRQLEGSGLRHAYVDIDQLGMLYPERPEDSERHVLKAHALGGVLASFADAGAASVAVELRSRDARPYLSGDDLLGQPAAVLDRFLDAALGQQRRLDAAGVGGDPIETSGRSVEDVSQDVMASIGVGPG